MRSFGGLLVSCWCCLGSDCHSKRLLSCKRVKRESWGRKAFYLLFYLAVGEIKVNSGVQILQQDSARLLLSSLVFWLLRVIIFTLSHHPPLFLSHPCWLLHTSPATGMEELGIHPKKEIEKGKLKQPICTSLRLWVFNTHIIQDHNIQLIQCIWPGQCSPEAYK